MGKAGHPTSQSNCNLPELFGSQTPSRCTRLLPRVPQTSSIRGESDHNNEDFRCLSSTSQTPAPDNLPRMANLRSVADDINSTPSSAIADLQNEVRAIVSRGDEVEATAHKQAQDLHRLHNATTTHSSSLPLCKDTWRTWIIGATGITYVSEAFQNRLLPHCWNLQSWNSLIPFFPSRDASRGTNFH